jgi:undecaprenyl diphosphate synthase
VDYSARDALVRAAQRASEEGGLLDRDRFAALVAQVDHGPPVPPVDLLIRTGGEQRLSDFLLWESAYAELFFSEVMWPDFSAAELEHFVGQFRSRERRFGALPSRRDARAHLSLSR